MMKYIIKMLQHISEFNTELPVYVLAPVNSSKAYGGVIEINMQNNFEVKHLSKSPEETRRKADNDRIKGREFARNGIISWEDYYATLDMWERNRYNRVEVVNAQ